MAQLTEQELKKIEKESNVISITHRNDNYITKTVEITREYYIVKPKKYTVEQLREKLDKFIADRGYDNTNKLYKTYRAIKSFIISLPE